MRGTELWNVLRGIVKGVGESAGDAKDAMVNAFKEIESLVQTNTITVPMVILPPGVLSQVQTNVVEIEPAVELHHKASEHCSPGIAVKYVDVTGSMVEPAVYVVETKRDGGGISLSRADAIAVIVGSTLDQLRGKTADGQIARIKADAFNQIARLVESKQ